MHGGMAGLLPALLLVIVTAAAPAAADLPRHTRRVRELDVHAIHTVVDPRIKLSADPPTILHNRENVTVTWSGVAEPHSSDWVGVYSPVPTNFSRTAPIKLQLTNATSSGSCTFALLAMRGDYVFALFRGGVDAATTPGYGGSYATVAAVSGTVRLTAALQDEPRGVHLSLTGAPTEMVVMWTTKTVGSPQVRYMCANLHGQRPSLPEMAKAETTSYAPEDLCPGDERPDGRLVFHPPVGPLPGGPAASVGWIHPGSIHRGILRGLAPGTNYTYFVEDGSRAGEPQSRSPTYWFVTPPAPRAVAAARVDMSPSGGIRLLAFGDMGTNEEGYDGGTNGGHAFGDNTQTVPLARQLAEQVAENRPPPGMPGERLRSYCGAVRSSTGSVFSPWWCGKPTAVLHIGDLSYAVGYSGEWEEWLSQVRCSAGAHCCLAVDETVILLQPPLHVVAVSIVR